MSKTIRNMALIGIIVFICIGITLSIAETLDGYWPYIITLLMVGFIAGASITLIVIQLYYKKR